MIVAALHLGACQSSVAPPPAWDVSIDADASPADAPAPAGDDAGADVTLGGPPYPVVLCHGFFGFDNVGPIDYFHGVVEALQAAGHDVHVTTVNPFQSSEVRGDQLIKKVEQLIVDTGKAKVNLVGQSQGGLDVRYVAHEIPELIAAVVMVAVPNRGMHLADVFDGKVPGLSSALTKALLQIVSRPIYGDIAEDADMEAALAALTSFEVSNFNASYPDQPGVAYYSIGGISNLKATDHAACESPEVPPFISKYSGARDPMDPLILPVAQVVGGTLLSPAPNDGMVRVSSAKWGKWLGCIPADHFDTVGQLLGDHPGLGNPFDHLDFYRGLADYLVSQGH